MSTWPWLRELWWWLSLLSFPWLMWTCWKVFQTIDKYHPIAPERVPTIALRFAMFLLIVLVVELSGPNFVSPLFNLFSATIFVLAEAAYSSAFNTPVMQRFFSYLYQQQTAPLTSLGSVYFLHPDVPDDLRNHIATFTKAIEDCDNELRTQFLENFSQNQIQGHYKTAYEQAFAPFLSHVPDAAQAFVFKASFASVVPLGHVLYHFLRYTVFWSKYGCFQGHSEIINKHYHGPAKGIQPYDFKGSPSEMLNLYLAGTPYLNLFRDYYVNFPLDPELRLTHMFINAASGTGKTQLLQAMIVADLEKVKAGEASIVVIDSQGVNKAASKRDPTIIQNIINLQMFATDLKGKLTYVNPNADLAFNIFDMGQNNPNLTDDQRRARRGSARNIILMSLAAGSDLQHRMLSRCIELALLADKPTLKTLQRILSTEKKDFSREFSGLLKRADEADPVNRDLSAYFANSFFSGATSTKDAVGIRVGNLTSEPLFGTMLGKPDNDFYLIEEIEAGKVIAINADSSPGVLGRHGAEAFGRFFLAQLLYASRQRETTKPVYVYCDEAHFFISDDENITTMLHEARKQDIGLILATSALHLINSSKVKESLQGVAIVVDHEKGKERGQFNLHLRNKKDAIEVQVKPHVMEKLPTMTNEQFAEVHKPKSRPPPTSSPFPASSSDSTSPSRPGPVVDVEREDGEMTPKKDDGVIH